MVVEPRKEIHFHLGDPIFSSEVAAKERGYRQSSLTVIDQLQSSTHFVGKYNPMRFSTEIDAIVPIARETAISKSQRFFRWSLSPIPTVNLSEVHPHERG
jgi:hypothetical protein